jgi:hypothetical protein
MLLANVYHNLAVRSDDHDQVMLGMYEKHHHKYPLSIELGTPAVPDDGQYHVIVSGKTILSTRVFDLAKITYEEQREELRVAAGDPDPREILRKENAGREVKALRSESVARTKNRGGGPGGKGGV